MADSARTAAETLLVAPNYVGGRNPQQYPICLGHLLRIKVDLGPIELHQIHARAHGVCIDLENLPPDVCRHRHRNRQCPRITFSTLGAIAGKTVPTLVRRPSHAELERSPN